MFFYLFFINYESSLLDKIRISSFNVISILSGTGYVTDDFGLWGKFSLIFFLLLMFIGGCAGSTTCGIKIFRVQILFQFISLQLKKIIYPRGIFKIKYENSNIDEKFLASIISFIFLHFVWAIHQSVLRVGCQKKVATPATMDGGVRKHG